MSGVIERYIQGRYSELKAGNAYLIYYQVDGFQMVELGRFVKNHELIRKIREGTVHWRHKFKRTKTASSTMVKAIKSEVLCLYSSVAHC